MGHEDAAKITTRAETKGTGLLWLAVLGAPVAWTLQIILAPDLAEILCYPGAEESGRAQVYGIDIRLFIGLLTVAMTVVGLAALIASVACWRRLQRSGDHTPGQRARWMAAAGMFVSGLFLTSILIGFAPIAFLSGCTTPL